MTNKTHRLVSVDRVATLIETYGSNPATWPEQEQAAARALIRESASLQALLAEAERIDAAILGAAPVEVDNEALLARIVDELPAQSIQPAQPQRRWVVPASLAASLAAILLVLGSWPATAPVSQPGTVALSDMDYWLWQDVTGQVTFENGEEVAVDFMNLLETDAG